MEVRAAVIPNRPATVPPRTHSIATKMPTTPIRRSVRALLTLAACAAALPAPRDSLRAQSPTDFAERFALASDRGAVVADLIPGTPDYYYFQCRERLDARDFESVRRILPTWIKRHGRTSRVIEIENREALLSFGDNQERTFDFLRKRLAVQFNHERIVPGQTSDLPTRLDPTLLQQSALTKRALTRHRGTVDGFHDEALAGLCQSADLDEKQLHSLLGRLDRPDVPNLPALIVRDLSRRASRGFGQLKIHGLLRREHLDECLQLRAELLQDQRFVQAYLQRLQPDSDIAWWHDTDERSAYLQRLSNFVDRLAPRFNSLKAHVLYHRLQHDLEMGVPNKGRFLAYIRLPRRSGYAAKSHIDRFTRRNEHVNLRTSYPTLMDAIGDDVALLRTYLEHFFASEDSVDAYSLFLDKRWLQRVLAETKLLAGAGEGNSGEMERWYSLLDDPAYLETLEQRVELRFPSSQKTQFGARDAVSLTIETKNVPALLVKVFAIDSYRYHVEKQKSVDASIDLDGIVANSEQTYSYNDAPMRRVSRTFDLPMLTEPGTYVVEFVGNGTSSRVVVHKGGLRMVETPTAAGHLLRVYDEQGKHVPEAIAWFGGQEYAGDDRGEILLPYSTSPGRKQVVLRHQSRSSMAPFQHRAESYRLHDSIYVDREALIAGNRAEMVIRPHLQLAGRTVALQLLSDPLLTITATDLDGVSTTQEVRDLTFGDDGSALHAFRVPNRLKQLDVQLKAKVEGMDGKQVALTGSAHSFAFNGIDATSETGVPLLMRTRGGYAVELRGKSGEPLAGRVCQLKLWHRSYRETIQVSLQTDEQGRIALGPLADITLIQVQRNGGLGGYFELSESKCRLPRELHGTAGQTLRVPYLGKRTEPSRDELSLLGNNRDAFANLAIEDGFLELRQLEPGDYTLRLLREQRTIQVRVTRGQRDEGFLIGQDRVLAATSTLPLQIGAIETDAESLNINVRNASSGARVFVVATRYLPAYDMFAGLLGPDGPRASAQNHERSLSSYHAGRKLSEEYRYVLDRRFQTKFPGNMLERPSILLNPMTLEKDSWNSAIGLGGGAGGRFGGKRGGRAVAESARAGEDGGGQGGNPGIIANLDFLPEGSTLLANLKPDADGVVRVPLADLGPGHHIHVVAIDDDQAVYRPTTRAESRLEPRSRTLPRSLATDQHLVETRQIEFVAAGGTVTTDEQRAGKMEIHDSLASVFRLLTTISNNEQLPRFAFVLQWPELTRDRKLALYDEHACHELHFFLYQKDRAFFDDVVRPYLAHKLDKTFLDEWLLGRDLSRHLEPWAFAKLNVIEKILLAQRVGGAEREGVARNLRESLELRPANVQDLAKLFDITLMSEQLEDEQHEVGVTLELMNDSLEPAKKVRSRGRSQAGRDEAEAPVAAARANGFIAPKPSPPTSSAERVAELSSKDKSEMKLAAPTEDFSPQTQNLDRRMRSAMQRKKVRQLYRDVEKTKLLVEQNWWQIPPLDTANIVPIHQFWVDFALRDDSKPFVSPALAQANGSFLEMMMALSVLDLPFEAGEHAVTVDGNTRTLKAASPLLVVQKEIAPSEKAADAAPLLLGQNFYRLNDRYRFVNGQRQDHFVSDEFLVDVAYGCQVVVTNPTSSPRTAEVLLQVPAGAVPLQNGFWTRGKSVNLAPYATATIEYTFYFPESGTFAHYPAHASDSGKLLAFADAEQINVVATPSKIDTTSWQHVSQQGTQQEVLTFLDASNVQRLDLSKIAWRMRDRTFFEEVTSRLDARHIYDQTLWSYGLLHRNPDATREYLRHRDDFLDRCGTWLESPLASIDPRERGRYTHLELSPLVHARAHVLGGSRKFGNKDLQKQYGALMDLLGYRPQLDSKDFLMVTYYFLLQDRVEDALASFAKIDRNEIETKVQFDYLAAYLCFYRGDTAQARQLASKHQQHPVAHWQKRFRDVLAQLDEAEGKTPQATDEPSQDNLAATAPALELAVEGSTIAVRYENLNECEVRYYELDVEFAFSSQPFADSNGTSAAFVQPNASEARSLPDGEEQITFALPAALQKKNVLIEVRAGGLTRSRQYFTNALDVRFLESFGQVAVSEPAQNGQTGNKRPLSKTYVKVFAKLPNGTVRFHKDGYTDLRGRFDYASLSDDPNRNAVRYAVLVLDEQRGAVIREIAPPTR
ncbi:MAG: hypothetical protein AB8H80_15720 [Planctomycetota bacterium]